MIINLKKRAAGILMLCTAGMVLSTPANGNTNDTVHGNDLYDVVLKGLSTYKPMYFIIGDDPMVNAKFTLSFKYRFLNDDALSGNWKQLNKLYVAYSQKSFWDLESESAPFKDNNYNPEAFYLYRDLFSDFWPDRTRMDIQTGYEHESNGMDGPESRSWDRLYLWPSWVFGEPDAYQFTVAAKLWAIIRKDDETNGDIADYMGYGELYLKYGKHDGILFDLMLRKGTASNNGAVRLNVSYPLSELFYKKINLYLYGQAYYGEGESLLFYDHDSTGLRLGLSLVR